jgi:hypothetical protein
VACEREQPLAPGRRRRRREPQRVLGQHDRLLRSTACRGACGGGRDRVGERCVGVFRREGQVARSQLVVRDDPRQLEVKLTPLVRTGALPGRRRQQRMRRAHTLAVDEEHSVVESLLDRLGVAERRELRRAQTRAQRNREQQPPHGTRELRDAYADEVLDCIRNGHLLSDPRCSTLCQRPPQLDREQRVAARGLVKLSQNAAGHAQGQSIEQQAPRPPKAQRADLEALQLGRRECGFESGRAPGTLRDQEADVGVLEPPGGEHERVGGRSIQPLDVVDGNDEGLGGGQRTQRAQQAGRDGARLEARADRLGPQERHLQRLALRSSETGQRSHVDVLQQIGEGSERQLRLGVARTRGEDTQPPAPRGVDSGLPQGRLADAGFAAEEERARMATAVKECFEPGKLRLAADQLCPWPSRLDLDPRQVNFWITQFPTSGKGRAPSSTAPGPASP